MSVARARKKQKLTAIFIALSLGICAPALAQLPPTNTYGLDFYANNNQTVAPSGSLRLRYNSSTHQLEQSISGGAYTGFASSLASAYTAGGGFGGIIPLTPSGGGLILVDTGLFPGTPLFAVSDATLTNVYLSVSSTGNSFKFGGAMTGSSIAETHDSTNAYTVGDTALNMSSAGTSFLKLTQNFSGFWDFTSANGNIGLVNSSGDGIRAQGVNTVYIYGANAVQVEYLANTGMWPVSGFPMANGKTSAGNFWASTISQHFGGGGAAPSKAPGACIGGTQTVTLDANATDTAGTITLTGTGAGTASSTCATITFNNSTGAWGTAPHCKITPANTAASARAATAALFVDAASTTTNLFVINVGSTALAAGTYLYTYDCTQ